EQINALKELADIVAKSGRAFDASDRKARSASPTAPTLAPPPPEPVKRTPPPLAEETPLRGSLDVETREREPQQAPQQSEGWVKDLLRGASREDLTPAAPVAPKPAAERSPLQLVESLNSLSVDIARAIDHEASIELWDRYRRGERNAFTRRLYTLKGQQTFDDIRRKYQGDPEFKSAVDRYCRDFEKLLQEVGRNDRDNMMTQTYLSSDTGKVYTMLAHASGRLK